MSKNPVYISRRNFLKVGAFTAAMATLSVPAFAASMIILLPNKNVP